MAANHRTHSGGAGYQSPCGWYGSAGALDTWDPPLTPPSRADPHPGYPGNDSPLAAWRTSPPRTARLPAGSGSDV